MKWIVFFLAACSSSLGAVWALPSVNQGSWLPGTDVGVVGGIAQYRDGGVNQRGAIGGHTTINITASPYNADSTGAASCQAAINSAIAASHSGDLIYFPAGTYKITSQVNVDHSKANITFRGHDPSDTTIYGSGANIAEFVFAGGGFAKGSSPQTITGTKTKGTSVLSVASTTGYVVGSLATVLVENEENNTRITAGASPTWSNSGFRDSRQVRVMVKAISTNTSITVDPPLPWDCTNYATRIETNSLHWNINKVGFENLSFTFDAAAHPLYAISMQQGVECWVYNCKVPQWLKTASNGSFVFASDCYKCEFRKNVGLSATSKSDDGFLQVAASSSGLIEDNIMVGWDSGFYNSGTTYNNLVAYNYTIGSDSNYIGHDPHNSLDLYEGNLMARIQADGYHGSASNLNLYRNWITTSMAFNRFNRKHVVAGNVMGQDGAKNGILSYGNPNIGNSNSTGTAQPTMGTFWVDWGMTGTLTTRTSDTSGVITVSGGDFTSTTGGGSRLISPWWGGFASHRTQMTLSSHAGLALTVTGGSGTIFPAQGTTFDGVWTFASGYQEQDLDVAASTTEAHNYISSAGGTGAITHSISPDTLPNSLAYTAKPSWWDDDGYALTWPPVNPNSPVYSDTIIPAGSRYLGVTPGGSAPVVTLTAPVDGTVFLTTDSISFSASASDVEDGTLTSLIDWNSNIDGHLGTGGSITHTLSAGIHTITASVTDSSSKTGSQVVSIQVVLPVPPASNLRVIGLGKRFRR